MSRSTGPEASSPSLYDLRLRVFLLALEPALRLARELHLDLDSVRDAVDSQYVLMYRDRGFSLEQIARRIGKSRRTVVTLARSAADTMKKLSQSRTIELRRAIVRRLSADRAMTREELCPLFVAKRDEVDAAIEVLLEDGFIAEEGGLLSIALECLPFDGASEGEKLDSVRHFLDAVTGALLGRFFTLPADDDAFARVLTFCAPPAAVDETRAALFESMLAMARDLDARAADSQPSTQVSFAFCTAKAARAGAERRAPPEARTGSSV